MLLNYFISSLKVLGKYDTIVYLRGRSEEYYNKKSSHHV
jgi:hypothetical protein